MGALPKAMAKRGHRVMVVVPRYSNYENINDTGVRHRVSMFGNMQEVGYFHSYIDGVDFVFVDHPSFNQRGNDIYGGGRLELMFRCALLSKVSGQALISKACRIGQVGLGKGLVDKDCEISIRLDLLKKAWTALRPSSEDQGWTIGLVARFVTWL